MGESKRRTGGSVATHLRSMGMDHVHYLLLADRSQRGRFALDKFLGSVHPEIATALKQKIAHFGDEPPEYVGFLGTDGFTGGSTVFAFDDDELMSGALPALIHRLSSKAGLCAFIVALKSEMETRVISLLEEVQAGYDEHGRYVVPERLNQVLTEAEENARATQMALHGGTPISDLDVVLRTSGTEAKIRLSTEAANAWREAGNPDMARACLQLPMEILPSGDLIITAAFPERVETLKIPAHEWAYPEENQQRMRDQVQGAEGEINVTPGKRVPFRRLHIQEGREHDMVGRIFHEMLASRDEPPSMALFESLPVAAHEQGDGSLIVTATFSATDVRHVTVSKGTWKLLPEPSQTPEFDIDAIMSASWAHNRMLFFPRPMIEAGSVSSMLELRNRLVADSDVGLDAAGKFEFVVDGYNEDPRFLHEIPEVLDYFKKLEREWPGFLFFLMPDPTLWRLYLSLTTGTARAELPNALQVTTDLVQFELEASECAKILKRGFDAVLVMLEQWGVDSKDPRCVAADKAMTACTNSILDPELMFEAPRPH